MVTICVIRVMFLFSSSENILLLDVGGERSVASCSLFILPDGGELTDLLALGGDTGSDLIEKYFFIIKKYILFPLYYLKARYVFHIYLPMCRVCKIQGFSLWFRASFRP